VLHESPCTVEAQNLVGHRLAFEVLGKCLVIQKSGVPEIHNRGIDIFLLIALFPEAVPELLFAPASVPEKRQGV